MTEIHTIQKGWQIAKSLKQSYSLYEIYEYISYKVHFKEGQSFNINMFHITATVTACLQYNHQYNSAENRSNSLDNLSLLFVVMGGGITSL